MDNIIKIRNFMQSDIRSEVLVQIGDQNLPTRLGGNTWIATLPRAFDGSIDLLLGTRGGGLIYLKSTENSNPEIGEGEVVNTEPPADFVF